MSSANVLMEFNKKIDNNKDYTLKELIKFLTDAHKKAGTAGAAGASDTEQKNSDNEVKKKAPSAYNKFMSECMKSMKQDTPTMNAKDIMKLASGKWKALSDEEKAKYK